MSLLDEMARDAQALPSDMRLTQVAELAEEQLRLEREVEAMEEALSAKKQELLGISKGKLPALMMEIGVKEFKLVDGSKITIKPFVSAKIDDENREACFSWLTANGHADIIKHEISVKLGKGEDEVARQVAQAIAALGVTYTDKESVHHQTLTSFIKGVLERGEDFPLQMFNVYLGNEAKIKRG